MIIKPIRMIALRSITVISEHLSSHSVPNRSIKRMSLMKLINGAYLMIISVFLIKFHITMLESNLAHIELIKFLIIIDILI